MATFIIIGIVLVPLFLLVADMLIGEQRLTRSQTAAPARRPGQ
jgi:hypothetical protein